MKKASLCVLIFAACGCGFCLSMIMSFPSARSPAALAEEDGATIADIMVVINSGKDSLLGQIKTAMRGSGPATGKAWRAVEAKGAVIATLGTDVMIKQTPPKGSRTSWRRKMAAYTKLAKSLAAAAAQEDFRAASNAVKSLGRSCNGCHRAHKD